MASSSEQLYQCKYCKEKFYPLLVHDLHVMSKHPLQWASSPSYTGNGTFSLATNDLLKIARREFGSLSSVTIDDVGKSTTLLSTSMRKETVDSETNKSKKRKAEEAFDDNSDDRKGESSQSRKTRSRTSTDADKKSGSAETSKTMSTISTKSIGSSSIVSQQEDYRQKDSTTYIARSIRLSRQNRLAVAGKPYYLDNIRDQSGNRHRTDNISKESVSNHSTTSEKPKTLHAFRCSSSYGLQKKDRGDGKTGNDGGFYVFQAEDAADLLCNLTLKKTKAQRQRKETAKNESKDKTKAHSTGKHRSPRFASRPRSSPFSRKSRRRFSDGRDETYERDSYRRRRYRNRIRRGHIYDSRMDKVQAANDAMCATKNALHLYLFKSSAGERGSTLNEETFRRKDTNDQVLNYKKNRNRDEQADHKPIKGGSRK